MNGKKFNFSSHDFLKYDGWMITKLFRAAVVADGHVSFVIDKAHTWEECARGVAIASWKYNIAASIFGDDHSVFTSLHHHDK